MNLKDKKLPIIVAAAAVIVILLFLIFKPGSSPDEQGPEVISKRVKIEMPETATDLSASIEPTTEGALVTPPAAMAPPQAAQAPVPYPAPVTAPAPERVPERVIEAKPAPVQKKIMEPRSAAPAPAVKAEVPKPVKTVKAEKKAIEAPKKKTAAVRKIAPANALALNIASFTSLSEAQGLVGKLKKAGYNSYVASFTKDSVRWHRVRVGFFATRDEATRAGRAIQSKFKVEKPWIAKPDAAELKTHL